jgi:hypothetical protein
MKIQLADQLLHKLLDSYERRANPASRAVSVGMDQLQGYLDDRDATARIQANDILAEWEKRDWIRLRWVRGESGNLLERVTLQADAVPQIFAYLKRTPRTDLQATFVELLNRYQSRLTEQFAQVLDGTLARLESGRAVAPFQLDDLHRNEDILRVLAALTTLDGELPERDFSARVLGDSKRLASLKSPMLTLIRRAYPDLTGLQEEEVWASVGLLPNPGHVYIHGPLVFRLTDVVVDASVFQPDLGLAVHLIPQIELVTLDARYVLTVENRTSFYDYVAAFPNDGLILYLGGFPNRARRQLLRRVAEFSPTTPFYHWGDLDYGGLAILAYLRSTVNLPMLPHQMDLATMESHVQHARTLKGSDRRNLKRLLANDGLQDVQQVIRFMLEHGVKLEQEVLSPVAPLG